MNLKTVQRTCSHAQAQWSCKRAVLFLVQSRLVAGVVARLFISSKPEATKVPQCPWFIVLPQAWQEDPPSLLAGLTPSANLVIRQM